ncbi:MAG: FxLYD domain-containing protein [Meiothermus sp.]|nr:FxLYD domain-containing protein [Meiothermus sp.]
MGWVLMALGVAALVWALRTRERRAEWLLCVALLFGVGFTQVVDSRNVPQNPDFARGRTSQGSSSALTGQAFGGGISYKDIRWLEEGGKRYIAGTVENTFSEAWRTVYVSFEVFDSAGNPIGVVEQMFMTLEPKKPVEFRLEVALPNASRFTILRWSN